MNIRAKPDQRSAEYEVLSPWADADPVPLRGIAPRLKDLEGKKIGLYINQKRTARMAAEAFEAALLERCPDASASWYECTGDNVPEMLTAGRVGFEAWVRGVDAVVLSVAD